MKRNFYMFTSVFLSVAVVSLGITCFHLVNKTNTNSSIVTTPSSSSNVSDISSKITGKIHFKVTAAGFKPISNARLLIVDNDGKVIATGLSDQGGEWTSAPVTVSLDPRFTQKQGTFTAISVADGYNEKIEFEVPVVENWDQPIVMEPFKPGERNEPSFELGNIHRMMVFDLLNKAAKQAGLGQQAVENGITDPHWSSKLQSK